MESGIPKDKEGRALVKELYMIGNSHIDPVWFWTWEEGMQEVKATFASALERMEEYPEFRFTCSSTAYLEWIQRIDPEMFARIQRRVAQGRFEIVGGWFVEPDCLLPGGEAFVRHALYGQRYLMQAFGKKCRIGFNIDSFGHNAVLPQILKKSGMDTYVFMRPRLEQSLFRWRAADGSQVQALALPGEYTTWFHDPTVKNIQTVLAQTPQWEKMACFYGVGDHGGGPTIENIQSIQSLTDAFENTRLKFATLEEFFQDCTPTEQPELSGPFEKINQGCYSVDAPFKSLYRQAERRLAQADCLMSMARLAGEEWMPEAARMEGLWKQVLFNTFHDTFGGTTIRQARDEAMMQLAGAAAQAGTLRGIAMQRLTARVATGEYGFPLFVVNTAGEEYRGLVEAELEWFCQAELKLMDSRGREIPYQRIHTDAKVRHTTLGGRRRFLFQARVPAYGVEVFYVSKDTPRLEQNHDMAVQNHALLLDNGILRAEFDAQTGALTALTQLATGFRCTGPHLCLYQDQRDCWGGLQGRIYRDTGIAFIPDGIEKIESGPLREVIRVRCHFQGTLAEIHYILEKDADALGMRLLLRFNHPWHLMKLAFPIEGRRETVAQTAYGIHRRIHQDDTEYNMQGFVDCSAGDGSGLSVANSGQYGFNLEGDALRITLTRSAIFAQGNSQNWYNQTETYEYTDLGEHRAEFRIRPHGGPASLPSLYSLRNQLERPVEYLMDTVHRPGPGIPAGESLVSVGQDNVLPVLLKKQEAGQGLILRLLETQGRDTQAALTILGRPFTVAVGAWAIETYLYENGTLTPTNLLEEPEN